jgi:DNA-directed RNA polymerase subunit RPC12/RpoP
MMYIFKCTNCGAGRETDTNLKGKEANCSFCGKRTMEVVDQWGHTSVYDTNDPESMRRPDVAQVISKGAVKDEEKSKKK